MGDKSFVDPRVNALSEMPLCNAWIRSFAMLPRGFIPQHAQIIIDRTEEGAEIFMPAVNTTHVVAWEPVKRMILDLTLAQFVERQDSDKWGDRVGRLRSYIGEQRFFKMCGNGHLWALLCSREELQGLGIEFDFRIGWGRL